MLRARAGHELAGRGAAGRGSGHRPVADAVPPGAGDLGCQVDRVDPGVVAFQVRPEQADQIACEVGQGDVVHGGLAFLQVIHEQVADRAALHLVAVDQFLDGALPGGLQERAAGDRRVRPQVPQAVQQPVGQQPPGAAGAGLAHRIEQLEVIPDRDVADQGALARQDHGDAAQREACLARGNPVWVGVDEALQRGVPVRVAAGGHRRDDPVRCLADHPAQRRADDVRADQHEQARLKAVPVMRRGGPAGDLPPLHRQVQPLLLGQGLSAGRLPPLLPAVAGEAGQPVQDPRGSVAPVA